MILLIMWVGGFKNGQKYAYIIKVWPLNFKTLWYNLMYFITHLQDQLDRTLIIEYHMARIDIRLASATRLDSKGSNCQKPWQILHFHCYFVQQFYFGSFQFLRVYFRVKRVTIRKCRNDFSNSPLSKKGFCSVVF